MPMEEQLTIAVAKKRDANYRLRATDWIGLRGGLKENAAKAEVP